QTPQPASAVRSTLLSIPLAVPQSLAYLSNQTSYDGTKWLHWRILSVFSLRLIRMVGPRATAAAAPVVVVTNSRRSIPLRLVIEIPPIAHRSAVRCRVPGVRPPTPDTRPLEPLTECTAR